MVNVYDVDSLVKRKSDKLYGRVVGIDLAKGLVHVEFMANGQKTFDFDAEILEETVPDADLIVVRKHI